MMYGYRFASLFKSQNDIDLWREVWGEGLAGVTAEQIRNALAQCQSKCEWPPTLPEFRNLCIPPLNYEEMFRRAINGDRADRLIYWSIAAFGYSDAMEITWEKARQRWISIVDKKRSESLPDVPPPMKALPDYERANKEKAKRHIAQVYTDLSTKRPNRAWAYKLLERAKFEDISPFALQMAEEAAGQKVGARGVEL